MAIKKTLRKQEQKPKKEYDYDKEAYVRSLCEGLNGKGCGTEKKSMARHRRVLSWEEICKRHNERSGD